MVETVAFVEPGREDDGRGVSQLTLDNRLVEKGYMYQIRFMIELCKVLHGRLTRKSGPLAERATRTSISEPRFDSPCPGVHWMIVAPMSDAMVWHLSAAIRASDSSATLSVSLPRYGFDNMHIRTPARGRM